MTLHASRFLYEDDHLLAVNKLSGELVVKGKGKVQKLPLLDLLREDYPELRAVHRLDFETSGVVVFAKTKEAYEAIRELDFKGWVKMYQTLVMGRIERRRGTINKPLPARGKGEVEAVSHFAVLKRFGNSSYVEVQIETGRHHQIRRHFAMIKHPLVLDVVYGHAKFNRVFQQELGYKKFFLHASSLSLPHPLSGEVIRIEAPLPKAFKAVLRTLGELL